MTRCALWLFHTSTRRFNWLLIRCGKNYVMQTEQIDYADRFEDASFFDLVKQGVLQLADSNEDSSLETLNTLVVYI